MPRRYVYISEIASACRLLLRRAAPAAAFAYAPRRADSYAATLLLMPPATLIMLRLRCRRYAAAAPGAHVDFTPTHAVLPSPFRPPIFTRLPYARLRHHDTLISLRYCFGALSRLRCR